MWNDCTEDPESCYAYVEDNCLYTGDRVGKRTQQGPCFILSYCSRPNSSPSEADEPSPGDVASIEICQLWAELWLDDGVLFFHYNSASEECHLYRTVQADCASVGGPKIAPPFEQCTTTKPTTVSPTPPTPETLTPNPLGHYY